MELMILCLVSLLLWLACHNTFMTDFWVLINLFLISNYPMYNDYMGKEISFFFLIVILVGVRVFWACYTLCILNVVTDLLRIREKKIFSCWNFYSSLSNQDKLPHDTKKVVVALLINSLPLFVWKHFTGRLNWVSAYEMNWLMNIRLMMKRKRPTIMSEIIQHD